jgi:hypothetical protein
MWTLPNISELFNPADNSMVPLQQTAEVVSVPVDKHEQERVQTQQCIIEETLARYQSPALVREVQTGPTITRYLLELQKRTKVSHVEGLTDTLAVFLAMGGFDVRFDRDGGAGKPYVAIEIPNPERKNVSLVAQVMHLQQALGLSDRTADRESTGLALEMVLGCDMAGTPVITDLAGLPHLLIAGTTGSGKSAAINSIIASFLLRYKPSQLQFIMIDPKIVELGIYNGIPHLAFPVVNDVTGPAFHRVTPTPDSVSGYSDKEPVEPYSEIALNTTSAQGVLQWAELEMKRRYIVLALHSQHDISGYHQLLAANANDHNNFNQNLEAMPYLVIIIDELADLMMKAPDDTEKSIASLAQKARAVGIHLIVATQRPSADVVTGVIKANLPARIAFKVASQVDSRVILDTSGAEKHLGKGDMLYKSPDPIKPKRIQGAFVSEKETAKLVTFWRNQNLADEKSYGATGISVPAAAIDPTWAVYWKNELNKYASAITTQSAGGAAAKPAPTDFGRTGKSSRGSGPSFSTGSEIVLVTAATLANPTYTKADTSFSIDKVGSTPENGIVDLEHQLVQSQSALSAALQRIQELEALLRRVQIDAQMVTTSSLPPLSTVSQNLTIERAEIKSLLIPSDTFSVANATVLGNSSNSSNQQPAQLDTAATKTGISTTHSSNVKRPVGLTAGQQRLLDTQVNQLRNIFLVNRFHRDVFSLLVQRELASQNTEKYLNGTDISVYLGKNPQYFGKNKPHTLLKAGWIIRARGASGGAYFYRAGILDRLSSMFPKVDENNPTLDIAYLRQELLIAVGLLSKPATSAQT